MLIYLNDGILVDGPGHEWDGWVEPEGLLDAGLQVLHLGEVLHGGRSLGVVGEDVVELALDLLLDLGRQIRVSCC